MWAWGNESLKFCLGFRVALPLRSVSHAHGISKEDQSLVIGEGIVSKPDDDDDGNVRRLSSLFVRRQYPMKLFLGAEHRVYGEVYRAASRCGFSRWL